MNYSQNFRSGTGKKYSGFMQYRNTSILFCIIVIAVFWIFFRGNLQESVYVEVQGDQLYLKSYTGEESSIPYTEITSITLTDQFDPGALVDGANDHRVQCGIWQNNAYGRYLLYTVKKAAHYLVLELRDGSVVVFNYETTATTDSVFEAFPALFESKGLSAQVAFNSDLKK